MQDFNHFKKLLEQRHSCRRFSDVQVADEEVKMLLDAAKLAPASKGIDSTAYVVVRDKEVLCQLSQVKDNGASFLKHASVAIAVLGNPDICDVWIENASLATSNILMMAEALGLGACWIQIRNRMCAEENVRRILNLFENVKVLCLVAIGNKR